ncbi:hypothetical protein ACFY2D_00230 [Streptomyces nigra]|uniref:hypothetical protein n=1 Tax=Streptomyces nigra TaxID=1827580 RepID=UPI00369A2EFE
MRTRPGSRIALLVPQERRTSAQLRPLDLADLASVRAFAAGVALTNLLLPKITDRVVTIASNAHKNASLDLSDPNWERRRYRASAAYGQSKLANLLFTLELQGRLTAAGAGVRALAAHPGAATTGLNRHLGPVMKAVAATVGRLIMQSETDGAQPTLFAATRDLPGASYVGPRLRVTLEGRTWQ